MTALLTAPPHPGLPAAVLAVVHEALDGADAAVGGSPAELGDAVASCERAIRRLEGLKLRLLGAAERGQVAATTGHASTAAWLASRTTSGRARCARETRLAETLDTTLAGTATALARGDLSTEHAAVIAEAARQLPARLTPAEVAAVEARLVRDGSRLDPVALRRRARRALAEVERDRTVVDAHEDALLGVEERRAVERARLTLHDNGDGTTTGHFTVPTLAASVLRKVLDAMTSPRRGRPGATHAQAGSAGVVSDWAHERGLAFSTVLEHLPTAHLHGKVAATVVVALDLESLRGRLRAAGLDTGDPVSAAQARRLACGAGLVPAVLDGASQPLDLGRTRRFFSEGQRIAGALRHTACAADGCDVPYAWTEAHHATAWSRGGRTDLRDLIPLCGFHHRRVHDPAYEHRRRPDGSVTFHRRT